MSFHVIDSRKEKLPNWSWERDAIQAIHRFAEFRFTTDGRFFSMVPDGEIIGHLMNALGCPDFQKIPSLKEELRSIEGAIVICDDAYGDEGEILPYRDRQELIDAWRELHRISGVAMSERDAERLAEDDEDEDEDED